MSKKDFKKGEVIIYKTSGGPKLDIKLEEETVWLSLDQMAMLFDRDKSVISRHIKNIFVEKELKKNAVVANFATTASDGKVYNIDFYSLDTIISVGYRVKSQRGVQFRIWATKTLKDHLVKGYTINEKKILEAKEKFAELQNAVNFLQQKSKHELLGGKGTEILDLLSQYSKTLTILEEYDKNKLKKVSGKKAGFVLTYEKAILVIQELRNNLAKKKQAGDLFGQEYPGKFESIANNIYQTFSEKELYGSIEEKAAHLLYLVIKDHPFADGNKRIASFLFIYFLDHNNYLFKEFGERKINDNALVSLALLIAISDPKEKDVMIKIITNLIK